MAKLAWSANKFAASMLGVTRFVNALLPLAMAFVAGAIITELTKAIVSKDMTVLLWYFAISLLIGILISLCNSLANYFSTRLRYDIESKASQLLMEKYSRLSLAQREDKEVADMFEQAEQFTSRADWIFDRGISIAAGFVTLFGSLIALSTVSIWLGLVIVIALLPSFVLQLNVNRRERFMWKTNSLSRRQSYAYRSHVLDIHTLSELRLGGLTKLFVERWRDLFTKDQRERMDLEKKTLPRNLATSVIENAAVVGTLIWGSFQIVAGVLPIGYFVTLQRLVSDAQGALMNILWMVASSLQDILNTNDFYNFLNLPDEDRGSVTIKSKAAPSIEFRDVTFSYPDAPEPTLKNVSFTISPSESIALVGENGSGKTTIIKLLLGFYQPTSGEILIDGKNLNSINKASWYEQVGVLFQDFSRYYFTTLGENIWLGDVTKKYAENKFVDALKKADIEKLPNDFKHGYGQYLSKSIYKDNGTDLSGGQWQRLALARSFFRSANILILDEPTAAVDAKAEYEIFQQISRQQKDKTTIIISHRFSTVRKAKKILVIEGGKIIESGTHKQLMDINGSYKHMFELQAEGYK